MFKTKHLKGQLGPPASGEKVYVCDVFAYSHTAPLPPVSWDPSKNIHFPKMCPPQKIEKPHDPILNCTHTWWAEAFILFVQIKKIQNEKMQQKIQNAKKSVFASPLLTAQSHTLHCNHFVFCSFVCPNRGSHFALTSDMTLCPYWDSEDEEDELDKEKQIDIFHLILA